MKGSQIMVLRTFFAIASSKSFVGRWLNDSGVGISSSQNSTSALDPSSCSSSCRCIRSLRYLLRTFFVMDSSSSLLVRSTTSFSTSLGSSFSLSSTPFSFAFSV
ncbi:unnamed protein product [Moneuplotes crassus]|uniref:Uncharacterized protein n=1 Tax=Euplotes crassus TaxID=5936 RepID=A0AAD2D7F6_EUPCR|nr:unnamed protein product [Moneuplotes crassus]